MEITQKEKDLLVQLIEKIKKVSQDSFNTIDPEAQRFIEEELSKI